MRVKVKKPYRMQVVGEQEFWEVELWLVLTIILILLVMYWLLLEDGKECLYQWFETTEIA